MHAYCENLKLSEKSALRFGNTGNFLIRSRARTNIRSPQTEGPQMLKSLSAGKIVETLSPVSGFKAESFGLSLFPNLFPVVSVVPSLTTSEDAEPFEMGAASHWCDQCSLETVPVALTNPLQGWNLFTCHLSECGCCYSLGESVCECCELITDCCECLWCNRGDHTCKEVCDHCDSCSSDCYCTFCSCGNPAECGECEECDMHCTCYSSCTCEDCQQRETLSTFKAPWVARGDEMPTQANVNVAQWIREESRNMLLDPVQAMADFYLCDYVETVLAQGFKYGTSMNNGTRDAHQLRTNARNFQAHIVRRADTLFMDYTFAAIGGEVRHHPSVAGNIPGGREDCWDYWHAMGETIGRDVLTRDCVHLFGDGSWDSGYGGDAWHTIAQTLSMRLQGSLDARTFVDRVFSLQHNGGSLLDKVRWVSETPNGWGVGYCQNIGNAHASERIGFHVLLENASNEVRAMVRQLAVQFGPWVPGYKVEDQWKSDHAMILDALSNTRDYANEED